MIIQIRGKYKKDTLSEQLSQIANIGTKATTYKSTLDIVQADIDRIVAAATMKAFVAGAKSTVTGWLKGLNSYEDQLDSGEVLQMMNAFAGVPPLGIAPAAVFAGIWHFIDTKRGIWMKHANWTEAIGDDMQLLGPITMFDTDAYTPVIKQKVFPGYIEFKTDSAVIENHNLYVGTSGIIPLPMIAGFKGASFKYYRTLPAGASAEKLDAIIRGVYNNVLIGHDSATETIAYKG